MITENGTPKGGEPNFSFGDSKESRDKRRVELGSELGKLQNALLFEAISLVAKEGKPHPVFELTAKYKNDWDNRYGMNIEDESIWAELIPEGDKRDSVLEDVREYSKLLAEYRQRPREERFAPPPPPPPSGMQAKVHTGNEHPHAQEQFIDAAAINAALATVESVPVLPPDAPALVTTPPPSPGSESPSLFERAKSFFSFKK
jgi:hypothetical protein